MRAAIRAIEYHLPEATLSTDDLAREFPEWPAHKIEQKTGIRSRHIAAPGECSSDLAVTAANRLFESGACRRDEIDYVLLCTQSPDYFLPTTACLIQDRLGLPTTAGALDYNLGCSGFVAGLGLAQGLIETGQARRVLLLTAETYSKFMDPQDKSVRTIFGDAAAATLVEGVEGAGEPLLGPFVYGTDGRGANNLIVRGGGMRQREAVSGAAEPADGPPAGRLYMNGAEIFNFTLEAVPASVRATLERAGKTLDDIDLFVFHQANRHMMEHLRKRLSIPPERFAVALEECGNTVSSTIPIALKQELVAGRLGPGKLLLLVGFGVGYSWAATLARWI
jgi:3-oxoacyl-[acyl-carrier-protein] synthase-3